MGDRLLTPTHAASWRRAAVQPVLEAYAASEAIDAVMLSGSTARGDADRWSDTEVGVFWSWPPTAEERGAIVQVAADIRMVTGEDANPPWYDHVYLGAKRPEGLMVEVVHTPTSAVEETLDTVLGSCQPDGPGLDLSKGIVEGREITGVRADVVRRWQERAATYPRSLAIAVVQRDGAIEQFWRWRMLVDRDNPLLLAREFMRVASQLLNVLHALNGLYCGHPSAFKRLDTLQHNLTIGLLPPRPRGRRGPTRPGRSNLRPSRNPPTRSKRHPPANPLPLQPPAPGHPAHNHRHTRRRRSQSQRPMTSTDARSWEPLVSPGSWLSWEFAW
jgi:predicted nucleotidyltransferase